MNSAKTSKGTELPLMQLKGKPYLLVGHRIVWLNDDVESFTIDTEFLHIDETRAVARATVVILNAEGRVIKRANATKSETKADFSDFIEKSETSAVGRALAMLGYGTQFALADLDEGNRLADSPITTAKKEITPASVTAAANAALARKKISSAEHAEIKNGIASGENLNVINNNIQRRMI